MVKKQQQISTGLCGLNVKLASMFWQWQPGMEIQFHIDFWWFAWTDLELNLDSFGPTWDQSCTFGKKAGGGGSMFKSLPLCPKDKDKGVYAVSQWNCFPKLDERVNFPLFISAVAFPALSMLYGTIVFAAQPWYSCPLNRSPFISFTGKKTVSALRHAKHIPSCMPF